MGGWVGWVGAPLESKASSQRSKRKARASCLPGALAVTAPSHGRTQAPGGHTPAPGRTVVAGRHAATVHTVCNACKASAFFKIEISKAKNAYAATPTATPTLNARTVGVVGEQEQDLILHLNDARAAMPLEANARLALNGREVPSLSHHPPSSRRR